MTDLTLGSLFDGSGGFPLAGILNGIRPVWGSEIEPFCVRVTSKRLPFVKHYGDINTLKGSELEPVDIITFGSPCQDVSTASGNRVGIEGSRSCLFYQAIRIIKEMRCETNGKYPRYIVWENVPGAFSSQKGDDFKKVLESICKIKDETFTVPRPENGKWQNAGSIVGDDFSIAWRILDAQYFGLAQRRRRIFLVADFAGKSAEQILFESEGVSRHFTKSICPRQRAAYDTASGIGISSCRGFDGYNGCLTGSVSSTLGENCGLSTGRSGVCESTLCLNDQGGERMDITENITSTIRAQAHHPPCVLSSAGFCTEHSSKSRTIGYEEEMSPTLRGGVVPAVAIENNAMDSRIKLSANNKTQTLTSRMGTGGNNVPLLLKIRSGCDGGGKGCLIQENKSATLSCNNEQTLFEPKAFGISSFDSNAMKSSNPLSGIYEAQTARTIDTSGENPSCNQGGVAIVCFGDNKGGEVTEKTVSKDDEIYCVDMGGGKSNCGISDNLSPTLIEGHHGEPAVCVPQTKAYALQGSMIGRENKNGPKGSGINEDVSFTLNSVDHHAVCYGLDRAAYNQGKNAKYDFAVEDNLQPTIVAKGPGAVASEINGFGYLVRRLTPTECGRLQGFPDCWCANLETENPTEAEIDYWQAVFEEYRKAVSPEKKPKSRTQIAKWLKNPHSDSAEYRMWGNGVALNCVAYVLAGIVESQNE